MLLHNAFHSDAVKSNGSPFTFYPSFHEKYAGVDAVLAVVVSVTVFAVLPS